jgi:hypothetical protein
MKDLALMKLAKNLVTKVKDKVAAKKRVWAEEAALSVEENKRREAEFKEDFRLVKETISSGTQKAKASIESTIEGGEKVQAKVEAASKSDTTKAKDAKSGKKKELDTTNHKAATTKSKSTPTVKKTTQKVTKNTKKESAVSKKTVADTKSIKETAKNSTTEVTSKVDSTKRAKETKSKVTARVKKSEKVSKSAQSEVKRDKKEAEKKPTTATKKVASKKESKSKKESGVKSTSKQATSKVKEASTAGKNKEKSGSKREAKIALYTKDVTKHYGKVDEAFLEIIVKNLGPSIYKKDAESVACSDPKELETVRKNFLVKKLGMRESQEVLDTAIKEVCEEMKASRNKYRATFYYALAKKLKQESKLS